MNRRWILAGSLVAITVGALGVGGRNLGVRFPAEGGGGGGKWVWNVRPMHQDEAINTDIFRRVLEGEGFRYNPQEYHGPTLYYFTRAVFWVAGVGDYAGSSEAHY